MRHPAAEKIFEPVAAKARLGAGDERGGEGVEIRRRGLSREVADEGAELVGALVGFSGGLVVEPL